ncbi:MAG: hypothetical protein HC795_18620 [Coleofasciculaceae cyanobacterium RL_1_1]|nr:hypothetical protein [Coleofasciculaceae cyanobacterium RL_1_1]
MLLVEPIKPVAGVVVACSATVGESNGCASASVASAALGALAGALAGAEAVGSSPVASGVSDPQPLATMARSARRGTIVGERIAIS